MSQPLLTFSREISLDLDSSLIVCPLSMSQVQAIVIKSEGLLINDVRFVVGDVVEIVSHFSSESFYGFLLTFDHEIILVRGGDGLIYKIPMSLVCTGRIRMQHDEELYELVEGIL